VTADDLARAYLAKARLRLEVLDLLLSRGGYSDVVREAQELVELATKAMLRHTGVELKWHDVGSILLDKAERFVPDVRADLPRVADISRALRKEREFAFYGDEDPEPLVCSLTLGVTAAPGGGSRTGWKLALRKFICPGSESR
jgi:HEPN domain-containing protein